MKTITAKDFQRNHATIVKEVAGGNEYEVTFHRRPLIKLVPAIKQKPAKPEPGSHEALIESLQYTLSLKGELYNLSYKQLRDQLLSQKYGK